MEDRKHSINNVTPLSLGTLGGFVKRKLWNPLIEHTTSTPLNYPAIQQRNRLQVSGYSSFELTESPIFSSPATNGAPFFRRKIPMLRDNLNKSKLTLSLDETELSQNNDANNNNENNCIYGTNNNNCNKDSYINKEININKIESSNDFSSSSMDSLLKKQFNHCEKQKSSPKFLKTLNEKKIRNTGVSLPIKKSYVKKQKITNGNTKKQESKLTASQNSDRPTLLRRTAKSPKLQTAERAVIKQQREKEKQEKSNRQEDLKIQQLREEEHKKEEEMKKIRQQTLFRAHPIRKYAPLPKVKKRPLTEPVTPFVCKRKRFEV
ncbi:hypothetical protein TKK_0015776 [Trichogramma kaykai]|uniref:TPX2 C-terminal domain-containing protein n=1 Tax=Trichogramma kaykai TaxID=54128 RepID=A0ABD2W8W3_9HYME